MEQIDDDGRYTIPQVAALTGVSVDTLYSAARREELKPVEIVGARLRLFRGADLKEYLTTWSDRPQRRGWATRGCKTSTGEQDGA